MFSNASVTSKVYLFDINSARQPVLVENFIVQYNTSYREEVDKQSSQERVKNGTHCRNDTSLSKGTNDTTPANANGTNNGVNGTNRPQQQLSERVRQLKEAVRS